MRPWERRLKDLAQLLKNCETTYFDPELFRMNTNQFLQTARTVTFIIQKNKNIIPNYDDWYTKNVIKPWATDQLMTWAKNSRNLIEKEGDLELYSSLDVALIYSYDCNQDISLPCGHEELVNGNIQKLLRFARRELPQGIYDSAVVKIERRWVANSLPSWELLHALIYVYARLHDCSAALALHLDTSLNATIPQSTSFDQISTNSRQVNYLKLNDFKFRRASAQHILLDPDFKSFPAFMDALKDYESRVNPENFHQLVNHHANFARLTFEQFGNHIPTLFIFDENGKAVDVVSTQFADQADKYIFWRSIADRVLYLRAASIIWICESWLRNTKEKMYLPNKKLSVQGEALQITGLNREGDMPQVAWSILREHGDAKPQLGQLLSDSKWNYLIPVRNAFSVMQTHKADSP